MEADPDYQFLFPNPGENIGTPILGFSDVSFGYKNGPTLFYNLNFGLDLESRAAVVGPNGMERKRERGGFVCVLCCHCVRLSIAHALYCKAVHKTPPHTILHNTQYPTKNPHQVWERQHYCTC